jgi:DNA-binding MarR family transcriptional regulator
MTPEPGSPWERFCPDAFPFEMLDSVGGKLPPGFRRFASDAEADLIMGRITEEQFREARSGKPAPSPASKPKRKPSAVVKKLFAANRFADGLMKQEPRLSPLAVAVWFWLWRCERKGLARCSVNRLAERFGVGRSTIQRRLNELRERGFIRLVRRGKSKRSASVYRVRSTPKPIPN